MNEAPNIESLFAHGAVAFETREPLSTDVLLPAEREFLTRAAPKRALEFAAGRACARAALAQLGYHEVALPMRPDRSPHWPPGITGSITHTGGFCAAVAATTALIRSLGVDAEPVASVGAHLWKRICTAEELAALDGMETHSALQAATLMFSAKEAFYKCQHFLTGEWLGFTDVSVTVETQGFTVSPARAIDLSRLCPGPWRGRFLREAGLVVTGLCIV